MNNKERKIFWDTLCSLKGENIPDESQRLSKVIRTPQKIYRFRSISNNSLEGLRSNRLYFSTADNYDDPFDSYSYIDWDKVADEIRQEFDNQSAKESTFSALQSLFGVPIEQITQFFNSKSIDTWSQFGINIMHEIRKDIQKNQLSICFTEKDLNEVLWLKYAGNHKGFVLEYDTSNDSMFLCGKMRKCKSCQSANMNYPLYPVYYSNRKYDATEYAKSVAMFKVITNFHPNIQQLFMHNLKNMTWQQERISLIKRKCHKYDKEWRMLYSQYCNMNNAKNRPFIVYIPSSVTIGLKTGQSEKNLIITLAKEAGIPKVYQCIINKRDKLDKKQIL